MISRGAAALRLFDLNQNNIELAQQMNDLQDESLGSRNLGEILLKQKMCEQGVALLYKCADLETRLGNPEWEDDWKTAQYMEELCKSQQT